MWNTFAENPTLLRNLGRGPLTQETISDAEKATVWEQACSSASPLVDATMYGWQKDDCDPSKLIPILMTIESTPKECLDTVSCNCKKTQSYANHEHGSLGNLTLHAVLCVVAKDTDHAQTGNPRVKPCNPFILYLTTLQQMLMTNHLYTSWPMTNINDHKR